MQFKNIMLLSGALLLCTAGLAQAGVTWPDVIIHLHASGHAYLVDPGTDKVVADLTTAKGGTLGTTTPDGNKLYVGAAASGENTVTAIDLKHRKVISHIKTGSRPKQPLASPNGKLVGVNHWGLDNGALRVSFIDTATDRVVKNIKIPVSDPKATKVASMHNAWSGDSRYFFTEDRIDNQLVVIDTHNWSLKEYNVSSAPHYSVPSPDGKELWQVLEGVDRSNPPQVVIYDLTKKNMPIKTTLDMPLIGAEVVQGHHGSFSQDGRYFYLLNRGGGKTKVGRELAVFDAKTKQLVKRITTASNGIGHAYNSPDGRYEVITNYGNNVITIIDNQRLETVKDLMIGTGRMGHVAFTPDSRWAYISNAKDGNLFKMDMWTLKVVKEIKTGDKPGGGQVLNVWTNVFEEIPN